jgi:hypothetical protein
MEARIDRDQIVATIHLQPVPCVEEQGDLGLVELVAEASENVPHATAA